MLRDQGIIQRLLERLQAIQVARTSRTPVFGLNPPEPSQAAIYAGRATRLRRIRSFLKEASKEEIKAFWEDFHQMAEPLLRYSMISENLIVAFDNNILEDVLNHKTRVERQTRFFALLALLAFAEDRCLLTLYFGITPTILYESHDRRIKQRSLAILDAGRRLAIAMEEIGIAVTYLGPNDKRDVLRTFGYIERDEKEIERALIKIRNADFTLDLRRLVAGQRAISSVLAEKMLPDIKLRYLSAWYVKYILSQDIERRLFEANHRTTEVMERLVWVEAALKFPRILKLEGKKRKVWEI